MKNQGFSWMQHGCFMQPLFHVSGHLCSTCALRYLLGLSNTSLDVTWTGGGWFIRGGGLGGHARGAHKKRCYLFDVSVNLMLQHCVHLLLCTKESSMQLDNPACNLIIIDGHIIWPAARRYQWTCNQFSIQVINLIEIIWLKYNRPLIILESI